MKVTEMLAGSLMNYRFRYPGVFRTESPTF